MQQQPNGPKPHWMVDLFYTVKGTDENSGLVNQVRRLNNRIDRQDLKLIRIALWGGLFLAIWTLVTSRDANLDALFSILKLLVDGLKAVFG